MHLPTNNPLRRSPNAVATGLGWFSVALGVAELLAPLALERRTGLRRSPGVVRLYGAREIATGVGFLTSPDPAPWVTARIAGGALDAATLLARRRPSAWGATALALGAVVGVMALDASTRRGLKDRAQHDRAKAWDYSDRVGIALPARAA